MSRCHAVFPVLGLACLAAACRGTDGGDTGPLASSVRDSAGVQVVEFSPAGPEASRIKVGAEPSVRIGTEGDTTQEFNAIFGLTRLADGTVVVADDQVRIRAYAPDGRLVRTVGRHGAGPGEFGLIVWISRCGGDSIFVYDSPQQRMSVLTGRLDFVRSYRVAIPPQGGGPYTTVCGADGRIAMLGWPEFAAMAEGAVVRNRMSLVTDDRNGGLRLLEPVPGTEQFRKGPNIGPLMFGKSTSVARGARGIAVATGDAHGVVVRDDGGGAVQVVRARAGAPVPVAAADLDARADAIAVERGVDPATIRPLIHREPRAEQFPAMGEVRGDGAGRLWLQRYPFPRDTVSTWDVISPEGAYLGSAYLPRDLRVWEIGADYVAGSVTGDEGVEVVRVYPFTITPARSCPRG